MNNKGIAPIIVALAIIIILLFAYFANSNLKTHEKLNSCQLENQHLQNRLRDLSQKNLVLGN